MKIRLLAREEKGLRRLPKIDQIIIAKKIRELKEKQISQEEKLKGSQNIFRVRLGNYRIVYRRIPQEIFIILIAHRNDVYNLLRRLF